MPTGRSSSAWKPTLTLPDGSAETDAKKALRPATSPATTGADQVNPASVECATRTTAWPLVRLLQATWCAPLAATLRDGNVRGLYVTIVNALGAHPRLPRAELIAQAHSLLAADEQERRRRVILVVDESHLLTPRTARATQAPDQFGDGLGLVGPTR